MNSKHIRKIAHITVGVSNLKKSVSFFEDVFGLEKIGEWPAYAIFEIAGVSFGLESRSKTEIYLLVDNVDSTNQTLRTKEPNLLPSQKINLAVFETQLLSTLMKTSLSLGHSSVKSAAKPVKEAIANS